jgi:hypothetical protein
MTQDEIIEMAEKAGIKRRTDEFYSEFCDGVYADDLEAFAKLVAAKEREACAKVCEDAISNIWEYDPEYAKQIGRNVCTNLATAIRARGEA